VSAPLAIEVIATASCWDLEPQASDIVERAILAAAVAAGELADDAEVAVMLTDDEGIRTLNANWREIDKPTNVLSFPAFQTKPLPGTPRMLGDIAIAFETVRREAEEEGKRFADHLSHLSVHGFLHLIGYDHENDDDARTMENLERRILASFGIADPYATDR
jgi:probable rRNA maturation factor